MNDVAALPFALTLPESPPFPAVVVELLLHDPLDEPYIVELVVHSSDHEPAPSEIVGRRLELELPSSGRPLSIAAVVATLRQETTEPTGVSRYRLIAVAPLWLASHRVEHRIFQKMSVVDITREVLRGYGGRIPEPVLRLEKSYAVREYVAQYGETDLAFVRRILSDAGIALCHLHDGSGAPVLFDNAALLPKSEPLLFRPPTALTPDAPHVREAAFESSVAPSRVTLRDYDYERPAMALEAQSVSAAMRPSEASLERYEFEVGRFRDPLAGQELAVTRLEEQRWPADRATMHASVPLGAGTVFTLVGHPRLSANREWLVVRSRAHVHAGRDLFEVETIPSESRYRPKRLPKPRVIGTQTAVVVGAPGESIDVDQLGRVCVRFRWDRRDKTHDTTRRARVSQAWAGPGYGFTCLPRVGDEVVIDFLDGDPDEPLVIGRVHNGQSPTPRPLPADKAVSTWRSQSTPGGGGFNEIALEDAAGEERIFVHAERDLEVNVGRNVGVVVDGDVASAVGGSGKHRVEGDVDVEIGGDLTVSAANITATCGAMVLKSGGNRADRSASHNVFTGGFYVASSGDAWIVGSNVQVHGRSIVLRGGGATIRMEGGSIKINAPGLVSINGALVTLNS